MRLSMLKGKIHRATVKQAALDYVGSITIDVDLLEASGIIEYEKVQIVDVDNGARFETYAIAGERIAAAAAGLHHSHSNARASLHLRPTPQLMATPDP